MWLPWVGASGREPPPSQGGHIGPPLQKNLLPATPSQPGPPLPDGGRAMGEGTGVRLRAGGRLRSPPFPLYPSPLTGLRPVSNGAIMHLYQFVVVRSTTPSQEDGADAEVALRGQGHGPGRRLGRRNVRCRV